MLYATQVLPLDYVSLFRVGLVDLPVGTCMLSYTLAVLYFEWSCY